MLVPGLVNELSHEECSVPWMLLFRYSTSQHSLEDLWIDTVLVFVLLTMTSEWLHEQHPCPFPIYTSYLSHLCS
jgi:hypothetical protein